MNISKLNFYPRTIAVVKDLPAFVKDHSNVSTWFFYQAHISQYDLQNYLRSDHYPDIHPVLNLISKKYKSSIWGHTPPNNTYIEVRENLLMGLEQTKCQENIIATVFLVAVTLIHELVHYACNHSNIAEVQGDEPGTNFENWAFGTYIEDNNAGIYYSQYRDSFSNLKRSIEKDETVIRNTHIRL